jgi:hypothetical protein
MIDEHNLIPFSGSAGHAYKSSQAVELSLNAAPPRRNCQELGRVSGDS